MKAILMIDINDELLDKYENFYVNYDLRALNKEDDYIESIKFVENCSLIEINDNIAKLIEVAR